MTPDELQNHLRTLDLCSEDRAFLFDLFSQGAGRVVGTYALDNVIVDFASKKCRDIHRLESHTVEQTYALELELDPDVISYVCQVTCRGIRRGRHITTAHADFLVIRNSYIEVVECKPISKLDSLVKKIPDEWLLDDGQYRNLPYERWAESHGITYKVWASPPYTSRYLRNLQFIYHHWDAELSLVRREGFSEINRHLSAGPKSISALMDKVAWFNAGIAAALIADKLLFGPVEHVPITDTQNFFLSLHSEQAQAIGAEFGRSIEALYLDANDPTSLASSTDVSKAIARLKDLDRLMADGKPLPRRKRELAKRVAAARAEGRNPLQEALTKYANSGNRFSRLTSAQEEVVEGVIKTHWLGGLVTTKSDLHRELAGQCERLGIVAPGYRALVRQIKKTSRATRDLAVGGKRQYQANKARSDARVRSGTALAMHSVLHIDATKVDHRTFIQGQEGMEDQCPLLYCGRDEASGHVMAHAFVFGPARRDGPLILLRNYVRKHKRLPRSIVVDRATDLKWGLDDLRSVYLLSILFAPTGGSRYNSQIEVIQGQINAMVSHRLIGSTKPDQAGRSVDGKFKSRSTARMDFSTTESEITELLYGLLPKLPGGDHCGPDERMAELTRIAPGSGLPAIMDDEFLFRTSVKLKSTSYKRTRGYRTCGRSYTNAELGNRPSSEKILDARRDPEDMTFIWIQTNVRRYKAWCSKVAEIGHYGADDRLFEAMWDQFLRPETAVRKEDIQRKSYERTSAANARQRAMDSEKQKSNEKPASRPSTPKPKPSTSRGSLMVDFNSLPDIVAVQNPDEY
ncbi:transposase [Xanthomonas cerealis]|uniref:transposase n=1 Tax=Xanthomonas cerealis TaxID=3390025 RepID=UPI000B232649|nr:transposase [Xanthomonas translucens]UKE47041.1 transposase [Xanthomonas translucens pv. cerealis]